MRATKPKTAPGCIAWKTRSARFFCRACERRTPQGCLRPAQGLSCATRGVGTGVQSYASRPCPSLCITRGTTRASRASAGFAAPAQIIGNSRRALTAMSGAAAGAKTPPFPWPTAHRPAAARLPAQSSRPPAHPRRVRASSTPRPAVSTRPSSSAAAA